MKPSLVLFTIVLTSFLSYSQKNKPVKLKKGNWISQLTLSDTDILPFEMVVEKKKKAYTFTIINGNEKIKLSKPKYQGDSILVQFPFFNSTLIFKPNNKKQLSGYWHNYNKGENYKIAFVSERKKGNRFNFIKKKSTSVSVDGRWEVTFEPNTNSSYPAVGVFNQDKNIVTGTFLTETGDYRYLAGNTTSDSLYLSCFDGSHAFLFKADLHNDSLRGKFFSGNHWKSNWVGVLNDTIQLKSPEDLTYIVEEDALTFELKDLEGKSFSYPNDDYKNKVVIIQIMGTWCPNCLDETQYYKTLYDTYHDKGLEVISVAYETGNNFDDYVKSINRLKDKLNLDFTFVVGGAARKNLASEHFSMLNEVISFPTSIFIGRDGSVQRVHTGFNGPGTGSYYNEYVKKTNALIESMLAK